MYKIGDLPDNLFSESRGQPIPKTTTTTPRTRNKKDGNKKSDSEKRMQESFEARNNAVEFSIMCETSNNLKRNLSELKSSKRKLFKTFQVHCEGDKSVAKARLRLFRNKTKVREVNKKKRDHGTSYIHLHQVMCLRSKTCLV